VDTTYKRKGIVDMSDVTVFLGSCNRPHLLEKTLDTFFEMNTYPLERFIIVEDGMVPGCIDFVKTRYDFPIEIYYNEEKLRQIKSIDKGYGMITTPYVFHMEDDWQFVKPNFIEVSKEVLEADENIIQVWLRGTDDTTIKHPYHPEIFESPITQTKMVLVQYGYQGVWHGFSFNPGLKRLKDWQTLPGGFAALPRQVPDLQSGDQVLEYDVSVEYMKRGKIAMRFLESYVRHTGWNDHIE